MANDAFMAGFNRTRKQPAKADDDSGSGKATAGGSGGGLPGLIGKGIQKLRGSKGAKDQPSLEPKMPAGLAVGSFKHGGKVKKTGTYLLHKNETVIPAGKHRSKKTTRKHTIVKA